MHPLCSSVQKLSPAKKNYDTGTLPKKQVLHHVFQLYDIPRDVPSDQGPQSACPLAIIPTMTDPECNWKDGTFQCTYQLLQLSSMEYENSVLSVLTLCRWCHRTRTRAWQILMRSFETHEKAVDCSQTPAPYYQSGKRVWLSTRDLPLHVNPIKWLLASLV